MAKGEALAIVDKDAPLRLSVAAEIAYPHGGMTASGLRREAARGRLEIERVAGRDYTTLRAIEEMRRLCRVQQKAPASISDAERGAIPSGKSGVLEKTSAQAALSTTLRALREDLKRNSQSATGRASQVVPLRSS